MAEIDREEAIKQVSGLDDIDGLTKAAIKNQLNNDSVNAFLGAKEYASLIAMRGWWSIVVMVLLIMIVVSDIAYIWLVGFEIIKIPSENIALFFVGQGVIKTLGLAAIIVKFLFHKDSVGHNKNKETERGTSSSSN